MRGRGRGPDRTEPNVHAGIKYMRHVVDQYFDDPEIGEVNQHLFAFAAHNAGPTRAARLRRLAPEHSVDPNLWFKEPRAHPGEQGRARARRFVVQKRYL